MAGLDGDVWPFLEGAAAEALVREYFELPQDATRTPTFTGALFERFGGGGDAPERRHRVDAEDLLAVSLLGVSVTGRPALRILDGDDDTLSALLRRIPGNLDLCDAHPGLVAPTSDAARLWYHLQEIPGIGWVTAGKLLARKRPRLIPVYDRVIKAALMPSGTGFWSALREEFENRELVTRLAAIRAAAGLDERISLLRVLDVAVWMRNRGIEQVQRERPGIEALPFTPKPAGRAGRAMTNRRAESPSASAESKPEGSASFRS